MFAFCKHLTMTESRRERFICSQLAGLAALGLDEEALAREESLLRNGFAQSELLARLFTQDGPIHDRG